MTSEPVPDTERRVRWIRPRLGFLLPFVLVTLLLIAAISGAAGRGAWRAMRTTRLTWNGERAAQAADEALAATAAGWDAEAFAERPIGARWTTVVATGDGTVADVALARTGPLTVAVEATSRSRVSGSPDTASRRIARTLALESSRFPLHGALTVLGSAAVTGSANIDGRDSGAADDGCGRERDTSSVPGMYAGDASVGASAWVRGTVPVIAPGSRSVALDGDRVAFDGAWSVAAQRASRRETVAAAALASARPWSARYVIAADTVSHNVVFVGTTVHDGLLLVDGNLTIDGTLRLRGLLVVRGALDTRGGVLDVDGGVIVRDAHDGDSQVGGDARVRYSPCSVLRAMAGIARPGFAPYGVWIAR